jgi:hypothetical protein
MKMFTRDLLLQGPPTAVREWATGIADAYEAATGKAVAVWTGIAGGTAGHYSWSMPVDGAATLVEGTTAAFADEAYLARIEEGRSFMAGLPRDTIYRSYTPVPDGDSEPGNVAMATTAVAGAGSLGEAVGWGIEVAQHVSGLTGIPTVLLGNSAGGFSRLTWMGVAQDAAAADAADDAMQADDEYRKMVARGGPYFVDGSGRTQLFLRIG